jgi:hypothetical protein
VPATPITKSTRFFQPGNVGILFLPTIAATTLIPTTRRGHRRHRPDRRGRRLAGWTVTTAFLETKDASTRLRPQLAGAVTFDGSSITFNGSKNGTDVRTILTRGQSGYIVFGDAGVGTGKKADVYPVVVGAVAKLRNFDNTNFKIRVDFGITACRPRTSPCRELAAGAPRGKQRRTARLPILVGDAEGGGARGGRGPGACGNTSRPRRD